MRFRGDGWLLLIWFALASAARLEAASPVWKVTGPNGSLLYLGGSMHALRGKDYPLPAAFDRAFAASSQLVLEVDPKEMSRASDRLMKAGEYPKGDNLKTHVDPRTYEYLRRVFSLMGVPEAKFSRYRPWFLALQLQSPGLRGLSGALGVEEFLTKRARASKKPISGLESAAEHAGVFSDLGERQSEALLLLTFLPGGSVDISTVVSGWRRGDAEFLWRMTHDSFREYPAIGRRVLEARNRAWMPQMERAIRSGQTHFVVVGAAHLGGPEGLLALLKAGGYQIEQL